MRTILNCHTQAPNNAVELGIIQHAIPIYWFGNPTAKVATVAINPGPREFAIDAQKCGYWGKRESFGTHRQDYTSSELDMIEAHCTNYFGKLTKLEKFWKRLEDLLVVGGASYVQANMERAFHVDLVPWATDPVWSGLEPIQQQSLLMQAEDARKCMFERLQARVFVCRGASAATMAGRTLGFFDQAAPWQRCSANGDMLIMQHPDGLRWLLATRQWDFDVNVKQAIGDALKTILESPTPLTPLDIPQAASKVVSAYELLKMMYDVASEVAEIEGPTVDLMIGKTQTTYTVWMNGHRGQKVATVTMNGGKIEFPASDTVVSVAQAFMQNLFTRTWNEKQACISPITIADLPQIEVGLRFIMATAIRAHPAFQA